MKKTTMLTAIFAMACCAAAPALAQEIEAEETVTVEREVVMATGDDRPAVRREIRVMRIDGARDTRRDTRRRTLLDAQIDEMEKTELRIVEMGERSDLSEAELKAITEARIAEGEMVIFSGKEMRCERRSGGEVKLRVCTEEGRVSALRALRKARATLAAENGLAYASRSRAIAALDRQIADLELATGR